MSIFLVFFKDNTVGWKENSFIKHTFDSKVALKYLTLKTNNLISSYYIRYFSTIEQPKFLQYNKEEDILFLENFESEKH